MPAIISVSRRTDVPAFYTPWLIQRVKEGFAQVRQPYTGEIFNVSLKPEDVTNFVFWTRNPASITNHLNFLDSLGYRYYFHVTLVGYPREIETNTPTLEFALDAFKRLSERVGSTRVIWRYDPIVLSSATPEDFHVRVFERIAAELSGFTKRCYFSFVEVYRKTARNLSVATNDHGIEFFAADVEAKIRLISKLAEIASSRRIEMSTCCDPFHEGTSLEGFVTKAECVSNLHTGADDGPPRSPSRKDCNCVKSYDIGAYDTCIFGCRYCYATTSEAKARENFRIHDPASPILKT
ncbi:MAG: DUF1848 domain-containing protein [Planctomycetes bacterium]|nr:DUF1848 domain-containing protein [Planctomycetota bacterium]